MKKKDHQRRRRRRWWCQEDGRAFHHLSSSFSFFLFFFGCLLLFLFIPPGLAVEWWKGGNGSSHAGVASMKWRETFLSLSLPPWPTCYTIGQKALSFFNLGFFPIESPRLWCVSFIIPPASHSFPLSLSLPHIFIKHFFGTIQIQRTKFVF